MPAKKKAATAKDFGSTANYVWQSTKSMRKHIIERWGKLRYLIWLVAGPDAVYALYHTVHR